MKALMGEDSAFAHLAVLLRWHLLSRPAKQNAWGSRNHMPILVWESHVMALCTRIGWATNSSPM
jgi:hypothetical protein